MVDIGGKSKANEWITKDGLLRIKGWARDGLSDKDIATKCLKIGISTFTLWKSKHESIKEALREGRAPEIVEIEDALKKNALGVFVIRETREETWDDGSGNTRKHTVTITKELPPDTTAQIFYLKRRNPKRWGDLGKLSLPDGEIEDDPITKALKDEKYGAVR